MNTNLIYLTGFMTCGKSTIGPILANVLGWDFFDLDRLIVEQEKMSINEVFTQKGEKYFREIERKLLLNCSEMNKTVIALGGGAITSDENLRIIKSSGYLIYLKIDHEVIYSRIKKKLNRPVFYDLVINERPKDEFMERIKKLIIEREPYYLKADLVFETGNQKIGISVDKLVKILRRSGFEND